MTTQRASVCRFCLIGWLPAAGWPATALAARCTLARLAFFPGPCTADLVGRCQSASLSVASKAATAARSSSSLFPAPALQLERRLE